jgi:DNA-binding response OmpR family regulator
MIRLLFHPVVLLLIGGLVFWLWARRVDLRVRLTRLPTPREWAILALLVQALRRLLRLGP